MKIFKTFWFFLGLKIFKTFSPDQWKRGKDNKTETEGNRNYIHSQTQDNPGFIDDTNFTDVDLNDGGRASASQSPMSRYITNVTARWGHCIWFRFIDLIHEGKKHHLLPFFHSKEQDAKKWDLKNQIFDNFEEATKLCKAWD